MKIQIELKPGFNQDNLQALKNMLSAYFDEYIKETTTPTSDNPLADKSIYPNGMKFDIKFDI